MEEIIITNIWPCLEIDDLAHFASGSFEVQMEAAISDHMKHCDRCADLVRELKKPLGFEVSPSIGTEPF